MINQLPLNVSLALLPIWSINREILFSTALRCGSFSEKISKRTTCFRISYFCKSDTPVINLILGSGDMIKLSKNMSLYKIR